MVIDPFSSQFDPTRTLSVSSTGSVLTDTTQDLVEAYDSEGRLIQRQTREGDPILAVTYVGTTDAINSIIDPTGSATTFKYTGGLLSEIDDAAGRPTKLYYNATSDLTSFQEPDGELWQFDYTDHRMTKKTSPETDVTTYGYDSTGALQTITKPAGETFTILANGYEQTPGADSQGNPNYQSSYKDPHGVVHALTLDQFGRVLTETYTADGIPYTLQHNRESMLGADDHEDPITQRSNRFVGRETGVAVNGIVPGHNNLFDSLGRSIGTFDPGYQVQESFIYYDGDDHGKARRFDRVERDRRVRRSSDGEARSSQRTSAFAVAV
jgi:YD repeat-containing protein